MRRSISYIEKPTNDQSDFIMKIYVDCSDFPSESRSIVAKVYKYKRSSIIFPIQLTIIKIDKIIQSIKFLYILLL